MYFLPLTPTRVGKAGDWSAVPRASLSFLCATCGCPTVTPEEHLLPFFLKNTFPSDLQYFVVTRVHCGPWWTSRTKWELIEDGTMKTLPVDAWHNLKCKDKNWQQVQ